MKFDFDDILIKPEINTNISSRYNDITLPHTLPLFTAPMDTVVNLNNAILFRQNKINVTLPRTINYELLIHPKYSWIKEDHGTFISLGFSEIDLHLKYKFKYFNSNAHILIDVANAHSDKVMNYSKKIKELRPDITIMVGNVANPDTYYWYYRNNCVDYIRLGIGNGGGCLTTKHSAIGYPMASLIHETYKVKQKAIKDDELNKKYHYRFTKQRGIPKIVADGGMKDYSDIITALGLGADYVMIGSLFNKAIESCGDNYLYNIKINQKTAEYFYRKGFPVKKYFRGMSTKQAQKAMGKISFKTSEGVQRYRKVQYSLNGWVENFEHYLRNAMSYSNAIELNDFIGNVNFIKISKSAYDRFNK